MVKRADFVIVGAGIAGASVASELASHGTVVVLERESFPGYHSTGRSAAVFTEIYGNAVIRALTSASASFFKTPPPGFTDAPLLHARPLIMIGRDDQVGAVQDLAAIASRLVPDLSILDREAILKKAPFLKASYLATGLLEPNSSDLDVNQIHVGFIRKAKKLGAEFLTSRDVLGITRHDGLWTVKASHDDFAAPVLINAAGAWADAVAQDRSGTIVDGMIAVTIDATRYRTGTVSGQEATSEHPVSFTVFLACEPAFDDCHTLRLSELDNPLR